MKNSLVFFLSLFLFSTQIIAEYKNSDQKSNEIYESTRQYTFSWLFQDESNMRPRGGTTKGPEVNLNKFPSDEWNRLQEPGLSMFEKDRRAILAMTGGYRTSFDFIETVGFSSQYKPAAPYQSWGTEYVYLIEDRGNFISLQHIIVMFIEMPDKSISDAMVIKHWRQDWQYEDTNLNVFMGNSTWVKKEFSGEEVAGTWSQSVYQVDDSPRYQAIGRWQHKSNYSSWLSNETWRPLPRREFSVRDDYDILIGTNRHTITPLGWVQEEENLKAKLLQDNNKVDKILAKEIGLARYEHIINHNWKAGDEYWDKTNTFWKEVRDAWNTFLKDNKVLIVKKSIDNQSLYESMFNLANESAENKSSSLEREKIQLILNRYINIIEK
tara:strand:- start:136 stop:1278 length:1143 start_codon:yes stop_codon:yes gene_type:complete